MANQRKDDEEQMKKSIYKNLLAVTLACTVALSTAPVSSFARDVANVSATSETEATTEKTTEAKKATTEKKAESSEEKTTSAEKTEAPEEKTTAATEKKESSEEKTTSEEKATSEEEKSSEETTTAKKATDTECAKPDKPVVDTPSDKDDKKDDSSSDKEDKKDDTDEATKPATVTLHFNQAMPGHVLSVSKASSFNFGGYASDSKATVKASYVGSAWNGKGYSSSTPSLKAGTYTETLYVTDSAYSATPISRTYTITRSNTHIIINNPVDCTYDGTPFAVDATVYDDNNNEEVTKANVTYIRVDGGKYSYLGTNAPVDAGVYIAVATYPGDATHRPSVARSLFIIHPKAVTVNIDRKEKWVGEEDPELTYDVDGVLPGDSLGLKLTREPGEDPGYYDIIPDTSSLNPNYKLAGTPDGTDHFQIKKKDSGKTDPVTPSGSEDTTKPDSSEDTTKPDSSENPGTDDTTDTEDTEPGDDTTDTDDTEPGDDTDDTTEPSATTTQKKNNTKKTTANKKNKKSKSSKTGDTSNPVLYMVVSVFALVMCAFIVLRRKTDR